jgi:hypothetical protein
MSLHMASLTQEADKGRIFRSKAIQARKQPYLEQARSKHTGLSFR